MENVVSKWLCTPLVTCFPHLFLDILDVSECHMSLTAFIFRIPNILIFVRDLLTKMIVNFVLLLKSHKNFLNKFLTGYKKTFGSSLEKFHISIGTLLHMFAFVCITIAKSSFCPSFV